MLAAPNFDKIENYMDSPLSANNWFQWMFVIKLKIFWDKIWEGYEVELCFQCISFWVSFFFFFFFILICVCHFHWKCELWKMKIRLDLFRILLWWPSVNSKIRCWQFHIRPKFVNWSGGQEARKGHWFENIN